MTYITKDITGKIVKSGKRLAIAGLLLGTALVGTPSSVMAENTFALKETVTIEGNFITLKDIFGEELTKNIENPDQPVIKAPAPGKALKINSRRLVSLAQKFNINWSAANTSFYVNVKRYGVQVTRDDIKPIVSAYIDDENMGGNREVRVRSAMRNLYIPSNRSIDEIYISDFTKRENNDQFMAVMNVPEGAEDFKEIRVQGTVAQMIDIPVLNKNILRGEKITKRDITYMSVNARKLKNAVIDEREMVGMAAQRTLRQDTLINSRDLAPPLLVQKGDEIYVQLSTGSLSIQMRAIAKEDGAMGETIEIENINSGGTLKVTVIGNKTARVNPAQTLRTASR